MYRFATCGIAATISAGLMLAGTASAGTGYFSTHTDKGGTISGSLSGTSTHKTTDVGSSRAEYRRKSQRSGSQSMGGRMKINGGDKISLIQVLNVKGTGLTGSSEPVSQLAVRRASRSGYYYFYIVQGAQTCTGISEIKKGEYRDVKVSYTKGGTPKFTVGGQSCQKSYGDRRAGTLGNGTKDRAYYGKLGAYNTSGGTTASSVTWTNKYD